MSSVKAPIKIRLKVAFSGFTYFFSSPLRALSFLGFSVFGFALINALFDVELLWTLTQLDVPLSFRLEAIRDVLFDPSGLPVPNTIAIFLMAMLFGYVLSATFYTALKIRTKTNKSGGVGILFGIISGGCAACGTSLLAPLLTAVGITTTSATLTFSLYLNLVGIILLLYSAYKVSLVVASNK